MSGPDISRSADPDGSPIQGGPPDRPEGPVRGPGPRLPQLDPLAALASCPPFRTDAVRLGPFDDEPFDLQPITWRLPSGNYRSEQDNFRCLTEWLTGALEAAGVTLGRFDRLQVHLIATDGWGPVQTVAGWITRAQDPAIGNPSVD